MSPIARPHLTKDLLYALYATERFSMREIARKMGCSLSKVHHWLKIHNIAIRRGMWKERREKIGKANSKPMIIKKCQICGEQFKVHPYREGVAKYCSYECHNKASSPLKGIKLGTLETIFGVKRAETIRVKLRKSHLGQKPWNQGLTKETDSRVAEYTKKGSKTKRRRYLENPELKRENRERALKLWKEERYVRKQMIARKVTPNKAELYLDCVLKQSFPAEWSYVGDGKVIIGGKCPDFIHNGEKAVIDLFGDYWHNSSEEESRIEHFKRHGYKCLVIWEHELFNKRELITKIESLIGCAPTVVNCDG